MTTPTPTDDLPQGRYAAARRVFDAVKREGETPLTLPQIQRVIDAHENAIPAVEPQGQWTVRTQGNEATALLDDGVVAAVIYAPWGDALGRRIAAALNTRPAPVPTDVPSVEDIFNRLPVESGLHSYLTEWAVEAVRDAVIDALSARAGTEDGTDG